MSSAGMLCLRVTMLFCRVAMLFLWETLSSRNVFSELCSGYLFFFLTPSTVVSSQSIWFPWHLVSIPLVMLWQANKSKIKSFSSTEFYFFPLFCPCRCGPQHIHGVSWGSTYVLIRPHHISCFSDRCDKTDRTPNRRNTGREDILTRSLSIQPSWCEDMVAGMWGSRWCLQSAREWQMWGMLMLPPEYAAVPPSLGLVFLHLLT